jgi:N-acetyl-anhydromuramyl-L-alanine amidase AmpD
MGNFEAQRPSPEQLQSCVQLVAWLCSDLKIDVDHVRGHQDAAKGQTDCPGRDFYRYLQDGQFKQWVSQALNRQQPDVHPGPPLPNGPTTQISLTAPATAPTTQKSS